MPGAGKLNFRLRFESRADVANVRGNTKGDWVPQFTVYAAITPLKGGEGVMAGRLSGFQPVLLQVRRTSQTLRIDASWRAVDPGGGHVYAITAPPSDMAGDRAFLDILATVGVPT